MEAFGLKSIRDEAQLKREVSVIKKCYQNKRLLVWALKKANKDAWASAIKAFYQLLDH